MHFQVHVIQLNRLDWKDHTGSRNPAVLALMSQMRMQSNERVSVKLHCLRMLLQTPLNSAELTIATSFMDRYLVFDDEEQEIFQQGLHSFAPKEQENLMQMTNYWIEQGIEQGIERGMEQGMEQGIEQGIEQGMERGKGPAIRLVHNYLHRFFPSLEEQISFAQLQALQVEQLDQLAKDIFDFQKPEDVLAWLAQARLDQTN